jgi:hypothetical protein
MPRVVLMSTFGDDTVARNLQYFMEQLQMAEETVTALTALRGPTAAAESRG